MAFYSLDGAGRGCNGKNIDVFPDDTVSYDEIFRCVPYEYRVDIPVGYNIRISFCARSASDTV